MIVAPFYILVVANVAYNNGTENIGFVKNPFGK